MGNILMWGAFGLGADDGAQMARAQMTGRTRHRINILCLHFQGLFKLTEKYGLRTGDSQSANFESLDLEKQLLWKS
jgi:hypothetical protein